MRDWLKTWAVALIVILTTSVLYLWAAPLTGPVGRTVVFTETNTIDIGGVIKSNLFGLHNQTVDPSPPPAGDLYLYQKSSALFTRDSGGNIIGPLGTGGGGGGTTGLKDAVRVATTTLNITLNGEQTIDGILTSANRVLVKAQTTGSQNGIYVSSPGAWSRASDADESTEFTPGFLVPVQAGTLGANTLWQFSTIGVFTLDTTTPTFAKSNIDTTIQTVTNLGVTYPTLTNGRLLYTQDGSEAIHAATVEANQITPTARTMTVSGSAGPVIMTTGNPRILGCSAGANGQRLTLKGGHATNTLTMPTGQGVKLCGNTGALTFGLNLGKAEFVCDGATTTWEQLNCTTLQGAANTGKDIDGLTSVGTALRVGDITGGNYCIEYNNTRECYCSGILCTNQSLVNPIFTMSGSKPTCAAGIRGQRWDTAGGSGVTDVHEVCDKDAADVYAWRAPGTVVSSITMRLDTVNFANANAFVSPQDRTNYDTNVIEYVETGTGCAHFSADIPANIATTPNWNLSIVHSSASGGAANVFLTAAARTFGHGDAKDAALTALTLAGAPAGTVAVQTSANMTRTLLAATNFDGQVSLAASRLLRVTLCRISADSNDSSIVSWFLERSPVMTLSLN